MTRCGHEADERTRSGAGDETTGRHVTGHGQAETLTAQINAALCKVLCHNLCVVIQSVHEPGIETTFGAETAFASKRTVNLRVLRQSIAS